MKTVLKVEAIIEIAADDEEKINAWRIEELNGKMWEHLEVVAPVSFRRGDVIIRGDVRFSQPTPIELKNAQMKNEN